MSNFQRGDRVQLEGPHRYEGIIYTLEAQDGDTGVIVDDLGGVYRVRWDHSKHRTSRADERCLRDEVVEVTEEDLKYVETSLKETLMSDPDNCRHSHVTRSGEIWKCPQCQTEFEPTEFRRTTEFQSFEESVVMDMLPKMESSSVVASLIPKGETDVKFAVELGFAIMLDKPLIGITQKGNPPLSEKLLRVVDEVVAVDLDSADGREQMMEALKKFHDRLDADETQ